MKKAWSIAAKEWREIRRDFYVLGILLLLPPVMVGTLVLLIYFYMSFFLHNLDQNQTMLSSMPAASHQGLAGYSDIQKVAVLPIKIIGIPFVLLNRYLESYPANCVQLDYRSGARAATAHLIGLGHRRIAHLTHGDDRYSAQERLAGYREALQEAGVPFSPDLVIPCTSRIEGAYQAVLETLPRLEPKPTALFAYNDIWCVGVLRALHELGRRVPEDISLMGCDDLELSGFLVPPLSTVFQDPYEIGRQGVDLLLEQLHGPSDRSWTPRRIVLRPELRLRASTAPLGVPA